MIMLHYTYIACLVFNVIFDILALCNSCEEELFLLVHT